MNKLNHLNIEVTNKCNQNCFYCFNNSGPDAKPECLPADKWLDILTALKQQGLKSVHFTGGEPFVYPEIIKLIKGSSELGLSTSILSNGFKIKDYAEKEPDVISRLSLAQISLDSLNAVIHNQRRGYPEAWNDAMNAINSLKKLNVPVEISSTISEDNVSSINELADFAKNNNSNLIIRPIIQQGRAKKISVPKTLIKNINAEISKINSSSKVNIVNDRFNYLSESNIQDFLISKTNIQTVNKINIFDKLSGYINIAAMF